MSTKKSKRWIFAVLVVTVCPAIAIHVSCVAVLGPGTWGSGLEEKLPEMLSIGSNPKAQAYAREFAERVKESGELALPGMNSTEAPWKGRAIWTDVREQLWVIQTYEGANWTQAQHLYLWNESLCDLEEIRLPAGAIIENPTLIERHGHVEVAYGRWNSWALSPAAKLRRYVQSWFEQELRPELSFYIYDPSSKENQYVGPGHSLVVSPDRHRGVILRSGALREGYYSVHVWEFDSNRVQTILSLRGVDEGKGHSFGYRWSQDSRVVEISGATGGFEHRLHEPRHFNLIYLVDGQRVYEVE